MIAFEIEVNGISLGRAGAEDLSVLVACVTAVGKLGEHSQWSAKYETNYDAELRVGGLTSRANALKDEHLDWIIQNLKPGDVVTIKVLESTSADRPISATPAHTEEDYKLQFEWAKKVYLENRDRFEGNAKGNDEAMKDER